jgi:hypothetical protein
MNTIAQMIEEVRSCDAQRLKLDRESKALKKQIDALSVQIIAGMDAAELSVVEGATIEEVTKPYISDFVELEKFIIEHGALDLLQKRLTESAVKLRWEDGIAIPGVGTSTERKLRL